MRNYKQISTESARKLGEELRRVRMGKGFTLKAISSKKKIDVGQLSRFERGEFKRVSPNLQKYSKYLQISLSTWVDDLGTRFHSFADRSAQHRATCELILYALEQLG